MRLRFIKSKGVSVWCSWTPVWAAWEMFYMYHLVKSSLIASWAVTLLKVSSTSKLAETHTASPLHWGHKLIHLTCKLSPFNLNSGNVILQTHSQPRGCIMVYNPVEVLQPIHGYSPFFNVFSSTLSHLVLLTADSKPRLSVFTGVQWCFLSMSLQSKAMWCRCFSLRLCKFSRLVDF